MDNLFSSHSVQQLIQPIFGKSCCRKQVGFRKSLSMGFGLKVPHLNKKARDNYYGEWEIGSYNSAWRVIRNGQILCASNDPVDSIEELDLAFNRVEFGCLVSLKLLTDMDVRLTFDQEIIVDFLSSTSDEDESFHVFCPQAYLAFVVGKGWIIESESPQSR